MNRRKFLGIFGAVAAAGVAVKQAVRKAPQFIEAGRYLAAKPPQLTQHWADPVTGAYRTATVSYAGPVLRIPVHRARSIQPVWTGEDAFPTAGRTTYDVVDYDLFDVSGTDYFYRRRS